MVRESWATIIVYTLLLAVTGAFFVTEHHILFTIGVGFTTAFATAITVVYLLAGMPIPFRNLLSRELILIKRIDSMALVGISGRCNQTRLVKNVPEGIAEGDIFIPRHKDGLISVVTRHVRTEKVES